MITRRQQTDNKSVAVRNSADSSNDHRVSARCPYKPREHATTKTSCMSQAASTSPRWRALHSMRARCTQCRCHALGRAASAFPALGKGYVAANPCTRLPCVSAPTRGPRRNHALPRWRWVGVTLRWRRVGVTLRLLTRFFDRLRVTRFFGRLVCSCFRIAASFFYAPFAIRVGMQPMDPPTTARTQVVIVIVHLNYLIRRFHVHRSRNAAEAAGLMPL